jgi:hypothetical protein|tara:strand:+ start:115 stop:723 length:609 start_codon:yes stop_codon:yes gene_type:complete
MAINFSDRSIVDFRSKMRGGGARTNLFEVTIEYPELLGLPTDSDGPKATGEFLIKAAEIPASNLGNIPVPFRGRVLPVAGDRTFDPWTVTVINDTNFKIRDAMEKWSNLINDLQTTQGEINPEEYQTAAFVKQLSREGGDNPGPIDILREYRFEGIYPNVVSSIPLDYGATDQIEEFQVTFNYLFYSVPSGSTVTSAGGSLI